MDRSNTIRQALQQKFEQYQSQNLRGISGEELRQVLTSKIGVIDPVSEGYLPYERDSQRDLSLKFHWGHNHDFGEFQLEGRMGDRHIDVLANFMALFPISMSDFLNKSVFDIGCWTGGTALLLAALGSRVVAIEEVVKYAETAAILVKYFDLSDQVEVMSKSLYECNTNQFLDRFDIVHFPGVVYHLTDPLLALRILFNSLKLGGSILIESEGIDHPEPFCRFDGSMIIQEGTKDEMNRGGWNWFIPSPSALSRMMEEAGFEDVQTLWYNEARRVYGYGKKRANRGICKAGLSVKQIP